MFLRNENTQAPLTIALTGDWGQGKSSLMNLVGADLTHHDTTVVWFNAWHHQKERHLFAALMQAVREQAIPGWWTLRGLRFRRRLVVSRARRHPLLAGVTLFLAGVSARLFFAGGQDPLSGVVAGLGTLVSAVLTMLASFPALTRLNPGRLMAAASGVARVKAIDDQLAFRYRFMEAFREVTKSLEPNTPLVLIDDLDRCRPEQVVETLEAINFLVSAAPCYVVMGFAPGQVISCVGLGYQDIARESSDLSTKDSGDADGEDEQRRRRRDYARQYLQKLVNIEVPVPKLTDEGARTLAEPTADGAPSFRKELLRMAQAVAVSVAVLALVIAGFYFSSPLTEMVSDLSNSLSPSEIPSQQIAPAPPPLPAEISPRTGEPDTGTDGPAEGLFRPGADLRTPEWSWAPPFGLLMFAALLAVAWHLWRQEEHHTQDAPDFTKALQIWSPVVLARTNSPREWKRFQNRVRYLAMVLAAADESDTAVATTPGEGSDTPEPPADTNHETKLSESIIVALAALQGLAVGGAVENGESALPRCLPSVFSKEGTEPPEFSEWKKRTLAAVMAECQPAMREERRATLEEEFDTALRKHVKTFEDQVTEEKLERFLAFAEGIVVH